MAEDIDFKIGADLTAAERAVEQFQQKVRSAPVNVGGNVNPGGTPGAPAALNPGGLSPSALSSFLANPQFTPSPHNPLYSSLLNPGGASVAGTATITAQTAALNTAAVASRAMTPGPYFGPGYGGAGGGLPGYWNAPASSRPPGWTPANNAAMSAAAAGAPPPVNPGTSAAPGSPALPPGQYYGPGGNPNLPAQSPATTAAAYAAASATAGGLTSGTGVSLRGLWSARSALGGGPLLAAYTFKENLERGENWRLGEIRAAGDQFALAENDIRQRKGWDDAFLGVGRLGRYIREGVPGSGPTTEEIESDLIRTRIGNARSDRFTDLSRDFRSLSRQAGVAGTTPGYQRAIAGITARGESGIEDVNVRAIALRKDLETQLTADLLPIEREREEYHAHHTRFPGAPYPDKLKELDRREDEVFRAGRARSAGVDSLVRGGRQSIHARTAAETADANRALRFERALLREDTSYQREVAAGGAGPRFELASLRGRHDEELRQSFDTERLGGFGFATNPVGFAGHLALSHNRREKERAVLTGIERDEGMRRAPADIQRMMFNAIAGGQYAPIARLNAQESLARDTFNRQKSSDPMVAEANLNAALAEVNLGRTQETRSIRYDREQAQSQLGFYTARSGGASVDRAAYAQMVETNAARVRQLGNDPRANDIERANWAKENAERRRIEGNETEPSFSIRSELRQLRILNKPGRIFAERAQAAELEGIYDNTLLAVNRNIRDQGGRDFAELKATGIERVSAARNELLSKFKADESPSLNRVAIEDPGKALKDFDKVLEKLASLEKSADSIDRSLKGYDKTE